MLSKAYTLLAAATLAQEAVAANLHRHAHQVVHEKRRLETDITTVTDWETVYVTWDGSSSTASPQVFVEASHHTEASSSSSSSSSTSTTPSSTPVTSTTPVSVAPVPTSTSIEATVAALVVATSSSPAPAATTASTSSSGSGKRGGAYNDASLLTGLTGSGSKLGWAYNWGQVNDQSSTSLEFVPMLWSPAHASSWSANAQAAINAGSKYLLSFNEPDNSGQANMGAGDAAAAHIQYMNPFASQAAIGTPAITNSNNAGEGISWLQAFISACAGQCNYSFAAIHWYNYADPQEFLQHLLNVYAVAQVPVWITEFAPISASDDDINTFLGTVLYQLDNNATFSFVSRYAYFMVASGSLVSSGSTLSTYGNTFAYGV